MLHGHVVALLDEAVVGVDVAAGADDSLRASRSVYACGALGAETLLARAEHHGVLEVLVPLLVHGARSLWLILRILV